MKLRLSLVAAALLLVSACGGTPTQVSPAVPESSIRREDTTPVTPPDTTTRGGSMGNGN